MVAAAGFVGWKWLISRRTDSGIAWPFRRALELNEQISRDYFQQARLAPLFPKASAGEPRVNGEEGMSEDFDPDEWKLTALRLRSRAVAGATVVVAVGKAVEPKNDGGERGGAVADMGA